MALEWNNPNLPWQQVALPWNALAMPWNAVALPWQAGSGSLETSPPINAGLDPVVTGTTTTGQTLSCTTGTWIGAATITYSYQWYHWLEDYGGHPVGNEIPLATSSTYQLVA